MCISLPIERPALQPTPPVPTRKHTRLLPKLSHHHLSSSSSFLEMGRCSNQEEENGVATTKTEQLPPLVVGGGTGKVEVEEEPLSPAARLFLQPNFSCHIVAIMGSARKIDAAAIKAGIEATLVRHPRFSSLQVLDREGRKCEAKWVRTTVVVDDHLVVPDLSDLTTPSPDKFVEDYISALSTIALDFSRPLWDIHILNLKTSEAEATAVLRIHHSLGDGISLMSLLLACFRSTSDPSALPTVPEATSGAWGREKGKAKDWAEALWAVVVGLWVVLRVLWNTMEDVAGFVASSWWLKDTETPIKGREGVGHNKKRFVHRTVSLEDVKTVKCELDATVNDVLLGLTSAGLTRYLSRRYACDGDNANGILPDNLRVRSTVLVNIRKAPGIHVLADMMQGTKANAPWGNWLGYIILPFPIVERDNPLDYVRTAMNIVNRKKASREALFTFWSAKVLLKLIGSKKAASISHKVLSNTTLSFSNVVGPLEEVSFYGHRLVYLAPSVYGHPQALTIHFQSYMRKMKIVVAVDETVIPDPHQLCEDMAESLNLMKIAASQAKH